MTYIQALIGIISIIAAAWLIGGRNPIDKKVVFGGLALQLLFVVLFLKVPIANECAWSSRPTMFVDTIRTVGSTRHCIALLGCVEISGLNY